MLDNGIKGTLLIAEEGHQRHGVRQPCRYRWSAGLVWLDPRLADIDHKNLPDERSIAPSTEEEMSPCVPGRSNQKVGTYVEAAIGMHDCRSRSAADRHPQ
jgi:hypothetical protein